MIVAGEYATPAVNVEESGAAHKAREQNALDADHLIKIASPA
jgi:hypothetical protein